MRKPRLNENTLAKLEIYGQAKSGKNYYELIDHIVTGKQIGRAHV